MKLYTCLFVLCFFNRIAAQDISTCKATLMNDTLVIENNFIARKFLWNNGDLITQSLTDKKQHITWAWISKEPDASLPGHTKAVGKGRFTVQQISHHPNQPDHLEVAVTAQMETLQVKRIFTIYPNVAAINCTFYLRGQASQVWIQAAMADSYKKDLAGIESQKNLSTANIGFPVMDNLSLAGNHWQVKPVEFFDVTDYNNTLVKQTSYNAYRLPGRLSGNILFLQDLATNDRFFILKEAPTSIMQLANTGFDFLVKNGAMQTVGIGILPTDITDTGWVRGYGYTVGLGGKTEFETLQNLRTYQDAKHLRRPERDEMVMMNTWGDRNKDAKLNEKFILDELKKAAALGITHYQIDDGWQAGRSINSSVKGGVFEGIYKNDQYWTPNPERFPNGFKPILDEAKRLHLKMGLWFSPSKDSSYKYWDKDAATLIRLYHEYSISTFKIDFVQIEDKTSEINFRHLLDSVLLATNYTVSFNLDVTAGRRNGYHFFNEYGNLWLENRYTDWTNYYPYWTLRNLWDLSKYVPAQNLQISFLNKWRSWDKYPADDPFAPKNYSFDYLFAITMMAQPMAFFEATGLPQEGFTTSRLVRTYLQNRSQIHEGQIFPIGAEPDGSAWTGFQSILTKKEGFILVFREDNKEAKKAVQTFLPAGKRIAFSSVAGSGKSFEMLVSQDGKVAFELPQKNTFELYKYVIK